MDRKKEAAKDKYAIDRQIRQEQDEAFEESLAIDRRKEAARVIIFYLENNSNNNIMFTD